MPTFPTQENDILTQALRMYRGWLKNKPDFPHFKGTIYMRYMFCRTYITKQKLAIANLKVAAKQKQLAFENLKQQMKNVLLAAEVDCCDCPEKLSIIGWSARKKSSPLPKPLAPLDLQAKLIDEETVELNWRKNPDSADVRNYIINRRTFDGSKDCDIWQMAEISYKTNAQITLKKPQFITEFCITAVNNAGQSTPSNIVEANKTIYSQII
jgi:hypothetical protein